MTDRLAALVALKEAVEADDVTAARHWSHDALPECHMPSALVRWIMADRSVDAALSLLAAVLPGRTWSLQALMGVDGVMFYRTHIYLPYAGFVEATASNEARAFLLAIIAAKIEEERNAG